MFNLKRKKKSRIVLEINDYVVRVIIVPAKGKSAWQGYEVALPEKIIENASIIDEMALFSFLQETFKKWGIKREAVYFLVPDTSVLLRTFKHPNDIKSSELKGYIEMELGQSIHLPFDEPLIDIYDPITDDGEAILFAAPSEEVYKISGILQDIHLTPEVADVRALSNIRYLEATKQLQEETTYLIANWSINELSIAIYSYENIEFLRYQSIDTNRTSWSHQFNNDSVIYECNDEEQYQVLITDQVLEIDRMMNFFKFSLHKGEREVDQLIVLGDNPKLVSIAEFLKENLSVQVKLIDEHTIQKDFPNFNANFTTLLGLALKGEVQ